MNINGEYGLIGDSLTSIDSTAKIELSNNEINLEATNVLVNGQAIGVAQGYVTNPLSSNLNCNNKNLFNAGTYNGFDLATISADIETLEIKTFHIDPVLSGDSTKFLANVIAPKFITSDTQPPRYLMSDGTELTNSGNNAGSNIYLYNNNNTLSPIPGNGQIRFNQAPQPSATQLYISHRTRDGIDIEDPFLSSISTLSIIYIQDQDVSENYIRFNVNSAPVIVVGSYVTLNVTYLDSGGTGDTNFGAGMNIFMSVFTNDIEIDTRLSVLESKTQNQSATASETQFGRNTTCIIRNGETDAFVVRSDSSVIRLKVDNTNVQLGNTLLMQGHRVQGVGLPISVGDAVSISSINAGNVPYFTSNNRLSGAVKNAFVQLTDSTIQSAIDKATTGGDVGWSIEVSSGSSTENVICVRQNYTIVGAICPPFTQTTQITGNLTIGSASFISTRVRVSHMKFVGNLIFDNSTNQQLRTYFYNCDWNGTITFPTSAATGTNGTQIFFDGCSFSGASTIVIPNQSLYTIFFTRCAFIGQTITNNQVIGNTTKLVFTDCSYLPTLSTLGNCILNGLNTTLLTTQANFGSIVLGGSATSLVKGNGTLLTGTGFVKGDATLDNTIYPTLTVETTFNTTFSAGGGASTSIGIVIRKISNGTSSIIHLYIPAVVWTTGASSSSAYATSSLPTGLRPLSGSVYNSSVVAVRLGTTTIPGLFWVFPNGQLQIGADLTTAPSSNPPANTQFGLANPTTLTYIGA